MALVVCGLLAPRPAAAYSVLSHEANIDALWDSTIAPMLRSRFPAATREQIEEARAYAYGGCVTQDVGYYPFGSRFFSNLPHYVRTGDFIAALIRDAQDLDEYAFALGALGHYAADNEGHPMAVNRAVPMMYPKLRKRFGDRVTYAQSPKNHVLVEFSFDVVQVAAHAYAPEAYHAFIGFQVAKPLLERAFSETYGIEMKDVFLNEDLAIGTYRHAVATSARPDPDSSRCLAFSQDPATARRPRIDEVALTADAASRCFKRYTLRHDSSVTVSAQKRR